MLNGIDFSFGSGVTTAQIKAAGYQFVCRYLSGGNSKDINGTELRNYKAAGIPVVFVFETTGTDMTSEAQGIVDAGVAQAELAALAVSVGDASVATAPVFFAADEATEKALGPYLQGVNTVLGKARTGIYGGLASVQAAWNAGLVAYGWQTYAWSNGQWDDRCILRQVQNDITVGPCEADHDQAAYWSVATPVLGLTDDFGQWPKPSVAPPPAPPKPAPTPVLATPSGLAVKVTQQPVLQVGSTNTAAVKELQSMINGRPVVTSHAIAALVVDGDFGPATEAAVKLIQSNCGVAVDGIVGEQTWNLFGKEPAAVLSWKAVANATTYDVVVDSGAAKAVKGTSLSVSLHPGSHSFKVAAASTGTYHASAWSAVLKFSA